MMTQLRFYRDISFLACLSVLACASPARVLPAAPTAGINAEELAIASDQAADALLVDVQSLAPGIRVSLRYATPDNFTGAPLPGYEGNRAYLRREAAIALARVSEKAAAAGLALHVYDAYRPARATQAMVDWAQRTGRQDLFRDGYIASRSRHNLGLAIDLTLVEIRTGVPLDMGTAFDTFSRAAHTANADGTMLERRLRLKRLMESEGFVNYEQEWWHYSYAVANPVRFDRVIR